MNDEPESYLIFSRHFLDFPSPFRRYPKLEIKCSKKVDAKSRDQDLIHEQKWCQKGSGRPIYVQMGADLRIKLRLRCIKITRVFGPLIGQLHQLIHDTKNQQYSREVLFRDQILMESK